MIKDMLADDVHFRRVTPLLLAKYSPIVQQNIKEAMARQKGSVNALANLMAAIHKGEIQTWVCTVNDPPVLVGMLFTKIIGDPHLETKELVLYGLNMKVPLTDRAREYCSAILADFARKNGCYAMRAETQISGVRKMMERDGWSEGFTTHVKEV